MMDDIVDTREAARQLGTARPVVSELARLGLIRGRKIGAGWLFGADAIANFKALCAAQRPEKTNA